MPKTSNILKTLMSGPLVLTMLEKDWANRQLAAAKIKPGHALRLRLDTLEDEGDGAQWEEHRKNLGIGQVLCPECEAAEHEPEACPMCKGVGMVPRKEWDEWYFASKGCRSYKDGCEQTCTERRCPYDAARTTGYGLVLMLEASTDGKRWHPCGNSLDGYRIGSLCTRPLALERFLNLISDAVGALSFSEFEEDEE